MGFHRVVASSERSAQCQKRGFVMLLRTFASARRTKRWLGSALVRRSSSFSGKQLDWACASKDFRLHTERTKTVSLDGQHTMGSTLESASVLHWNLDAWLNMRCIPPASPSASRLLRRMSVYTNHMQQTLTTQLALQLSN